MEKKQSKFWTKFHAYLIRIVAVFSVTSVLIATGCGGGNSAAPQASEPAPVNNAVASVTVIPSSASIHMGATEKFKAQAKNSDGAVLTGVTFSWASSSAAASVSSSGMATGDNTGDATITATANGVVGQAALKVGTQVGGPVLTAINISPNASTSILVGGSQTYAASALDQTGAPMEGVSVTWHSSGDAASISASGVAIGAKAGTTQISASAAGISSNSSLLTVSLVPPPAPVLTSIIVTPRSPSIQAGTTQAFQAAAFDQYSHSFPATFAWSSDTPNVATIDASTGIANGISAGVANIFADADGVRGASVLTVTASAPPVMFSGPWEFATNDGLYFVEANLTQTGNSVGAQAQENNPSFIQAELLSQTYPYAIHLTNGISFVSAAGSYSGGFLTLEFIDGNNDAITFTGSLSGGTLVGNYNGYGHSGSFQAYAVPAIGQGWSQDDGTTGNWIFNGGPSCDQCFLQATFTAGPDANYTWNNAVQIECLGSWQCGNPKNGQSWTTNVSASQMGNFITFYTIQPTINGYINGSILFLSGNGSF